MELLNSQISNAEVKKNLQWIKNEIAANMKELLTLLINKKRIKYVSYVKYGPGVLSVSIFSYLRVALIVLSISQLVLTFAGITIGFIEAGIYCYFKYIA